MDFPRYHKEIVGDLLDGKFVLATDAKFIELKNNADFYGKFFKETFDFYLDIKSDYAYLISEETMEMLSRDICIFIGLLCYELDKEGKNFLDESTWRPCCAPHNLELENNSELSNEYQLSKISGGKKIKSLKTIIKF